MTPFRNNFILQWSTALYIIDVFTVICAILDRGAQGDIQSQTKGGDALGRLRRPKMGLIYCNCKIISTN